MAEYIDMRGMDADKSWSMIIQSISSGKKEDRITPVTDSLASAQSIMERAQSMGLETSMEEMGGAYYLHFIKSTKLQTNDKPSCPSNKLIAITGLVMGRGEETLGKALMKGYLYHLKFIRPYPRSIIFLNEGVRLTTHGSEAINDLRVLSENGVELLSSSTCLEYYGLRDQLQVGDVASMRSIIEKMNNAENALIL